MEPLLYVLCTSLPCHIIVFFQYWDFPWRSKKLAAALACANILLKMWVVYGYLQAGQSIRGIEFLFSFSGALIYCFLIRVNHFKLLFTYVLVLDYLIVVRGIASFMAVRLWKADAQSRTSSTICVVLLVLTLPWLLHYFRRTARQVYLSDAPKLWRIIWLIPTLTTVAVLLYTDAFDDSNTQSMAFLIARLSLMVCMLVVYIMLLQTMDELRQRAILEEQARQNERILTLQRTQYAQLRTHMEEIRRARHDLRQHQNVIRSYLETGNETALREYLRAQSETMPPDTLHRYCGNYAVNMLLNHYAGCFAQEKIDFTFQVDLPDTLAAAEPDVCVVLGNLLENAQEACEGQTEPYIRAAVRINGTHAITIVVDNSAPTPPQVREDGVLLSHKREGSGIGTQSIRYIAGRYCGTADFRWEEGMFLASVFLNPQAEEGPET